MKKTLLALFMILLPYVLQGNEVPRRIIAFWDSSRERLEDAIVPNTAEMVLNHLGLDVLYYDFEQPLPNITQRQDICGILLCLQPEANAEHPDAFIDWILEAMNRGIKVILMRNPGFQNATLEKQNQIYKKLGFTSEGRKVTFTFDYAIQFQDPQLSPFEKKYPSILPSIDLTQLDDENARSLLKVASTEKPEEIADLIIINQAGGYINPYYESNFDFHLLNEAPQSLGWYINPFLFFKMALGLENAPIPDTTTLAGRRLFYSVCHGDAWNIETSIEEYQKEEETYASEVLLEKVIKPNPDVPVAVAIVAGDVDPKWVAKNKSQEVAKSYLLTPQVEAASHTYSHPFDWEFFAPGKPEKESELNLLYKYHYPTWQNSYLSWLHAVYTQFKNPKEFKQGVHSKEFNLGYVTPRAYATEPFNVEKEIGGSIDFINTLAPSNNKVSLLLWSGDGLAWGGAVELCYKAGVKNLGVGSTRFDAENPSYLFVGPLGRKPGGWFQIYNSSNGENDYTYEWEKDFHRFILLKETLKNTGTPLRVKPLCLYYHSYSGEFESSVNAILKNLDYIRSESPITIRSSRFCEIGIGFYTISIEKLSSSKWKIRNRNGLQTLRFDHADNLQIDFTQSLGVVGYTMHQNALYIYLDEAVSEPIVAVKNASREILPPYLVDSSWEIWGLRRENHRWQFQAKGWGKLQMNWFVPQSGSYLFTVKSYGDKKIKAEAVQNLLSVELDLPYNTVFAIEVTKI